MARTGPLCLVPLCNQGRSSFALRQHRLQNSRRKPQNRTGKIPYIEIADGNEAETTTSIGDSTLIIKHLAERQILPDLNGDLAPELKANDLAIRALLEDKAYFYNVPT